MFTSTYSKWQCSVGFQFLALVPPLVLYDLCGCKLKRYEIYDKLMEQKEVPSLLLPLTPRGDSVRSLEQGLLPDRPTLTGSCR